MDVNLVKVYTHRYTLINKKIKAEKISLNYGVYETDELII